MIGLTPEEAKILVEKMYKHKTFDNIKNIEDKNRRIVEELKNYYPTVYIAGNMDNTENRFYMIQSALEKEGIKTYNPYSVILPREQKGELDYTMLERSKVILAVMDKIKLGTSMELGFMMCRKRKGENVKIILCYTGDEEYKMGIKAKEFLRKYHPMTVDFDYITDSINDAIKKDS